MPLQGLEECVRAVRRERWLGRRRVLCGVLRCLRGRDRAELADATGEEQVGLDEARARVKLAGVLAALERVLGFEVGRGARDERRLEVVPVGVRRPDLEALDLRIAHAAVLGEPREVVVEARLLRALHDIAEGSEQELQRRQALLPVDDLDGVDLPPVDLDLVEDHRPEEVVLDAVAARAPRLTVEDGLGASGDVLPERLPLLVLLPHVRALEKRHDVPPLLLEHLDERELARLHAATSPPRARRT